MSLAKIKSFDASIADKKAEIASVEASHLSPDERGAALDQQIARAGDAVVQGLAYRIGVADYYSGVLTARVAADGRVDVLPALVALFGPDVIRTALDRYIGMMPAGPTKAERDAQIATLSGALEKLELQREMAIRALEAQGVEVIRSADASPAAVLADL